MPEKRQTLRSRKRETRHGANASSLAPQVFIGGLDERGGARRAVARNVFKRRTRRLDLRERHSLLDHGLHAVADDGHHVAILDDLKLVANAAFGGDNARPAFGELL